MNISYDFLYLIFFFKTTMLNWSKKTQEPDVIYFSYNNPFSHVSHIVGSRCKSRVVLIINDILVESVASSDVEEPIVR